MLYFIKNFVKTITNCHKMFHFMETKSTKPLPLAIISSFSAIFIYNIITKFVGIKPCALGWIPRSGIYFPLLKKCPSQIRL